MHENRETSAPPASRAGRPEKAISRTTGAYGAEESDCVVVPVNEPNKGRSSRGPTAEVGEGRTQAKENINQDRTCSTQSERGVSQALAGVRQAAKEKKRERFTALLHHLTPELLRASFYDLKRGAAPGVDGVRWREYEQGLEGRLGDLHSRIHRGAHRAQASRRVYIPKADGRQRPLGIAALEDKLARRPTGGGVPLRSPVPYKTFLFGPACHDVSRSRPAGGRPGLPSLIPNRRFALLPFALCWSSWLRCRMGSSMFVSGAAISVSN